MLKTQEEVEEKNTYFQRRIKRLESGLVTATPGKEDEPEKPKKPSFNEKFAIAATKAFGSMATFWILCVWACLPLIPLLASKKDAILYISSGFIQLVSLPLIIVGQNIMNIKSENRSERTLDTVLNTSETLKSVVVNLNKVNTQLTKNIIKDIEKTAQMQTEIVKIQTALASDIADLKNKLKIQE